MAVKAPVEPLGEAAVHAVGGEGGAHLLDALSLEDGVRLVQSPRQASILLLAGSAPQWAFRSLARLHDQMPHPRASVCWGGSIGPLSPAEQYPADDGEGSPREVAAGLRRLQAELFLGRRPSSDGLLPDEPPAPWRGEGDHGQGGEGMMGGKPYGRPMAMTAADLRDGLELDAYPVVVGPFASMLPWGLELEITLQGDVLQFVEVRHRPFGDPASVAPFADAHSTPISMQRLERLRAAHHLRCIAALLRVRGQSAGARGLLAAARRAAGGSPVDVGRIGRRLRWTGLLAGIAPGLGTLSADDAQSLEGPAHRAAGGERDHRNDLDAYGQAGFQPLTQTAGDVRSRVLQWLQEAAQALALATGADDTAATWPTGVEGPAGPVGAASPPPPPFSTPALNRLLAGLEWGEAVTVLASFDANALRHMLRGVAP